MVVKPMVDYFLDSCKYSVLLADQYIPRAKKIIKDRTGGKVILWKSNQTGSLQDMVDEADLVVSMLPPQLHISIARSCIKNKTSLVTTSYISPGMKKFDQRAKSLDLIFLNEIGEDPGLDHMDAKRSIDIITAAGGQVISLESYGAGLPHLQTTPNPFGYKFSWSPRGVFKAATLSAVYLKNGKEIFVSSDTLFEHVQKVDIDHIGSFETYPNRDCRVYVPSYQLIGKVSFFRGLLRYPGWCDTMQKFKKLNLLDDLEKKHFKNKTYKDFTATLIEEPESEPISSPDVIQTKIARYLKINKDHDFMNKINWLGLFSNQKIFAKKGTNLDLVLDLMLKKMSYGPDEKDITIVHNKVVSVLGNQQTKLLSTLLLEGDPGKNGAMARAVSLPAAIASRYILEKKIKVKGVQLPTHREIYQPVLDELEEFGIVFKQSTI